jgi:hypothetical protein
LTDPASTVGHGRDGSARLSAFGAFGLYDDDDGADDSHADKTPSTVRRRAPSPLDLHPLSPTPNKLGGDGAAEEDDADGDPTPIKPRALSAPWLDLDSRAPSALDGGGRPTGGATNDDRASDANVEAREPLSFGGGASPPTSPPTSPRRPSLAPWEYMDPPTGNNGNPHMGTLSTRAGQTLRERASHPLIPKSSYYFGPPPADSAYGSDPVGKIGMHHPREVLRVERDYTGGEVIQFASVYPLELEGRLTPTQFLESMNAINEVLIDAHSLRWAFWDNVVQVFSLQLSRLVLSTYYDKQMLRLERLIESLNAELFNPVGLNIIWPRSVAFLFMEIEYY